MICGLCVVKWQPCCSGCNELTAMQLLSLALSIGVLADHTWAMCYVTPPTITGSLTRMGNSYCVNTTMSKIENIIQYIFTDTYHTNMISNSMSHCCCHSGKETGLSKWNLAHTVLVFANFHYDSCRTSSVSHTRFHHLYFAQLILQLFLPNPLKPGVKSRMKM